MLFIHAYKKNNTIKFTNKTVKINKKVDCIKYLFNVVEIPFYQIIF